MSWCSRLARWLVCVVLSTTLFAQEGRDRDYDDRKDHDDHRDSQESDHLGDREHPRTLRRDYLILPGFTGSRAFFPLAANAQVNTVSAMPFYLNRFFRVGHISLSIAVPQAGSHAYVGIYNSHGRLLVQGKFPTDTQADLTLEISPRVLLKPGMYYFAIGAEDTVSQGPGFFFDDANLNFIHAGAAANPIMDGSLPERLGTVTSPLPGSTASAAFTP
jgi:hypothetical protein